MKRVVVIGDLHSGHRVGLTPPRWQWKVSDGFNKYERSGAIQRGIWNWYRDTIITLKPIDVLVINGDAIDGTAIKSGGTELISTDRNDQVDMAIEAIQLAEAKEVYMTYGTAYHTGEGEDWEKIISDKIEAKKIDDQLFLVVDGITFDFKHHIGSSSAPGRPTGALAREAIWAMVNEECERQPKSDILIRSHVHYFSMAQGLRDDQMLFTMPALQGPGSKYGGRRCSGKVDIGLMSFDINGKENISWTKHLLHAKFLAKQAIETLSSSSMRPTTKPSRTRKKK